VNKFRYEFLVAASHYMKKSKAGLAFVLLEGEAHGSQEGDLQQRQEAQAQRGSISSTPMDLNVLYFFSSSFTGSCLIRFCLL